MLKVSISGDFFLVLLFLYLFLQKQTLLRRVTYIASNSLLSVRLSGKSTLSRDPGIFKTTGKECWRGMGRMWRSIYHTTLPLVRHAELIRDSEFLSKRILRHLPVHQFLLVSYAWTSEGPGISETIWYFLCALICANLGGGGVSVHLNLITERNWDQKNVKNHWTNKHCHFRLSAIRKCTLAGSVQQVRVFR